MEQIQVKLDADIYKQLFNHSTESMILTNDKGIIELINPRVVQMFGYEEHELVGQSVDMLLPESLKANHQHHRTNYLENPTTRPMGKGMNLKALKKDGSTLPVEISLNYFHIDGKVVVMALIMDISERNRIERELQQLNEDLEKSIERRSKALVESQKLYRLISRNFPEGTISVFDEHLNYVFIEGQRLYKSGIDSTKLIGTSIESRLPEDVKEPVIKVLKEAFSGRSDVIEFKTKDEYFELNVVPLYDDRGGVHQILVVERNVTTHRNAENEVKRSLEKERNLNEMKSRFVSMASHEFRTPLSTILTSVSLIDRYSDTNERVSKHVNRIKGSVNNLTSILNDFLSIDRLETGNISPRIEPCDLHKLCKEVIEEIRPILRENQKIHLQLNGKIQEWSTDLNMVKNIMINLLSNASKYSDENKNVYLKVSTEKLLEISVKDEGIGIPQEEQDHLFERFFRAGNVLNIQGTGLGLNIVKKYLDILGGKIKFTSSEQNGTEFTVQIPKL